ncbi:hypothetical protein [Azotobacter beijerinckii]|uniref:hypothetical protein n=1 Tax=Azotobacter beijerinckii TaxID=170623 RepID=UPI00295381E8|nr:hypothetical protein [Azotobacter beijerinckii]MDV7211825.1 hypothetical protein [Azotobacter beijerinckii]
MREADWDGSKEYPSSVGGQPVDEGSAMPEPGFASRIEAIPGLIYIGLSGREHFLVATHAGSDGPRPAQRGAVRLDGHIEPLVLLHVDSNIGTLIIHIVSVIVMLARRNGRIGTCSNSGKILPQVDFRGKCAAGKHAGGLPGQRDRPGKPIA